MLSNDDLFLSIALSFDNCKYTIIEISDEYYFSIKDKIPAFALIITSNNEHLIKNTPIDVKEIIALTEKDNFESAYCSATESELSARNLFK